ncbi:AI-2E family transporter [Solemya pervernicosa gill symbiont]|uniref:AI-2E family transporter n=2 Tax=Gammaproteobacteria incertae sedis TaxID=118884 RepID=A0A1T2L8K1_9GAMM|nr:AI-2E family transporter [Candidatus Reidiella endopervernicosa]OOZ41390.1 AI-2E family transporter [Solemya pervernicosa gill symbiont]QKQ27571.1 AI-2E family transporter [Candidatus Reidiella endopervernicosa]
MSDSQRWMVIGGVAGAGWLLYLLGPVLVPFMAGGLLAYLGDPLVDRLEAKRLSRTVSVTIVFAAILSVLMIVLFLLVPILGKQLGILIGNLPGYFEMLQGKMLPWLQQLGIEIEAIDPQLIFNAIRQHWGEGSDVIGQLIAGASQSGMALLALAANLLLIPVVTFYLLRDWDILVAHIHEMLPRRIEPRVTLLTLESDEVLGAFLRGQMLVMLALATIYTLGLWMVGLELALLIGVLAGLVSFVPYLGLIVGVVVAGVAALMQFQDVLPIVLVFVPFIVGQLLEGMVLTPKLVGDRIGLHPVAVIFAVLAGGQLFGFLGVLLALPVAAVIMVMVRHLHQEYLDSALYDEGSVAVELEGVDQHDA